MPSESTEMYLITIYRLTTKSEHATVGEIAEIRGIHHSSVSEKIRRMEEQNYVTYTAHDGVNLTEEGHRIAVAVLRKHRLIKTFLVNMAEYPIDEVYDEACRLEHAISDRLADSLEKILGNPEVDPHGYPIPAHDGTVHDLHFRTLNDYHPGDTVVVRRVDALNHDKLSYLKELGLIPGAVVQIDAIAPFDGPLTLTIGENVVAVAPSLAQEVEVSEAGESNAETFAR